MFRKAKVFLLAVCVSAPAFGSQGASAQSGDVSVFLEGVRLSYNGQHEEAQAKFGEYERNHHDDLLVPLRSGMNQLFDVRSSKMSKDEYHELLGDISNAIILLETKKCVDTDLQGIAGGTLDCDYVGAALYSFRAALRMKNERWYWVINNRKMLRADDDQFFYYAKRSKSRQALFLIGVHEYELCQSVLGSVTGDPHDCKEALATINRSLDDESPFADDIWFYVLRLEFRDLKSQKDDGGGYFEKDHPWAAIVARLYPKYPRNRLLQESPDSYTDSYESH
jgi:hypothetical protein